MRRRAASSLFLAVMASALLAACGSDPGATAPVASSAPAATTAPAAVSTAPPTTTPTTTPTTVVAPSSLQFSADLVAGDKVDFRQYAGQTLALWFWAPT